MIILAYVLDLCYKLSRPILGAERSLPHGKIFEVPD